jgi:zinc/manganese transport system ATP-binding protein
MSELKPSPLTGAETPRASLASVETRARVTAEPRTLAGGVQPVVRIECASVELGGRTIWENVNLEVDPGEFIAVLGPNGSGKSTLIKAMLGLVPLSRGSITVDGVSPRRGRRAVGYVPQRRSFGPEVHVRGRDLVRLGLDGNHWGVPLPPVGRLWGRETRSDIARKRVQQVIEMVGAEALADRPIGKLSGGEQQRLLIAEALVTEPRVLLLDEPLDSLDLSHQQEVSSVIRELSEQSGAAVFLVAHDVNPLLQYVDRLVYLAAGQVVVGKPEEVITTETLSLLYGTSVEVLRTSDGRLVVVGQPEGMPCAEHHHGPELAAKR